MNEFESMMGLRPFMPMLMVMSVVMRFQRLTNEHRRKQAEYKCLHGRNQNFHHKDEK